MNDITNLQSARELVYHFQGSTWNGDAAFCSNEVAKLYELAIVDAERRGYELAQKRDIDDTPYGYFMKYDEAKRVENMDVDAPNTRLRCYDCDRVYDKYYASTADMLRDTEHGNYCDECKAKREEHK